MFIVISIFIYTVCQRYSANLSFAGAFAEEGGGAYGQSPYEKEIPYYRRSWTRGHCGYCPYALTN